MYILFGLIYLLACAAVVTMILMQKKRSAGMGSISGMGNADTYWDKNKGRSMEGRLENWTKIGGAVIFVFSIVMCML